MERVESEEDEDKGRRKGVVRRMDSPSGSGGAGTFQRESVRASAVGLAQYFIVIYDFKVFSLLIVTVFVGP